MILYYLEPEQPHILILFSCEVLSSVFVPHHLFLKQFQWFSWCSMPTNFYGSYSYQPLLNVLVRVFFILDFFWKHFPNRLNITVVVSKIKWGQSGPTPRMIKVLFICIHVGFFFHWIAHKFLHVIKLSSCIFEGTNFLNFYFKSLNSFMYYSKFKHILIIWWLLLIIFSKTSARCNPFWFAVMLGMAYFILFW